MKYTNFLTLSINLFISNSVFLPHRGKKKEKKERKIDEGKILTSTDTSGIFTHPSHHESPLTQQSQI